MSPVLIGGIILIVGAIAIGVKLVMPSMAAQSEQAANASGGLFDKKKQLVDSTTRLVERGSGNSLAVKLEKAGSQLRSGEWVLLTGAATLVICALGFLLGRQSWVPPVVLAVAVPVVARFLLNRKITQRQEAFADQLPDFLQNLSSSLRSGQSLTQSIAGMAPDMASPAGDELRRVVIENRIGRDLIESFKDLAARMDSLDFDWVVRAIEINYRTGGDLSVILRRLDATIRARNQVAGAVRALTAEGRISGIVLTALPPGLLLAVQFLNPEFLKPMFETPLGNFLLIVATVQLFVGSIWLSRMARFKF